MIAHIVVRMKHMPPRTAITIFLSATPAVLSGCIVQDIHDQIALSNEKLERIDESFAKVERANVLLEQLDTRLDATLPPINENLTRIDARLATIDTNLESMDSRLDTLRADLEQVSAHLASLRKTINNIDSTIPFLSFSGDDDEEKEQLEADDAEPQEAEPKEAEPDADTPDAGDATPGDAPPEGPASEDQGDTGGA